METIQEFELFYIIIVLDFNLFYIKKKGIKMRNKFSVYMLFAAVLIITACSSAGRKLTNVTSEGDTETIQALIVNDGYGEYVFVPAGEFEMGDNFSEGNSDERPVHTITLDAYYIGKYEVTNTQFAVFLNDRGAHSGGGNTWYDINASDARISLSSGTYIADNGFEDHPVVEVTWYGATEYAVWLSEKTGKTYRLPTEAEWEKAARGDASANSASGHQRRYPWGDDIDDSYANYSGNNPPGYNRTSPVGYYDGSAHGSFQTNDNASPYGAFDMAGNVWEWVSDWYSFNYYASSPSSNPVGPASGSSRVIRGGSWLNGISILRSALRLNLGTPDVSDISLGFRCVRDN